jgi:hypothetical protein
MNLDSFYKLRKLLDWKQDNELKRTLDMLLHEIERETQFINQTIRIFESLNNKKNGDVQ